MKLNFDYISRLLEYEKVENGLYIIGTPIGNLGDITIRSLKLLMSVDLIICEDTRVSKKLTSIYGIKTPLKSFHKFNSKKMIPSIIKKLNSGLSIALISDSGTPIISDPGSDLVQACSFENIRVFSIPGPSSPIASIVLSDFSKSKFSFRGFIPRQKKYILQEITLMKANDSPTIFFESPKRILKTLKIILNDYKNCNVTFIRELTKKNEEVINSTILNLIETLEQRKKIYGEITLIIEPLINENKITISKKEIAEVSEKLLKDGLSISEISKTISKDFNISKREIYQLLINK
tara:strand:+ start:1432 stop:2310 length:879 start_codon:yes stop_codon:yes gene_type:complete